jgi:hypothetical protein
MFDAVNNVPDIYLDELQMELHDAFGVNADKSTIWRALRRSGYTMKKVCTGYSYIHASYSHLNLSYLARLLSGALKNALTLQRVLERTKLNSWFLLTRVQLTAVRHTEDGLGRYVVARPYGRLFLYVGDGK